jgi:hypothetical protein
MGNTIKTLTAGDITRKALSILHNKATFLQTINKQYDDRFAVVGAKNGGYLEIREPNEFTVRTGAIMDTQDVTETTTQLVLATQMGVDINFSSAELTLSLDDFSDRILDPAMTRLSAEVVKTVLSGYTDTAGTFHNGVYQYINQFENTTFGTKPVLADVLDCRARLQQGLAPTSDRHCMVDALAANSIITDGKSLYHAASEIERQYKEGALGRIAGIEFFESEMTPVHTNGTFSDSSPVTDLSLITNGMATIAITAAATGTTLPAGTVFTIAGVYNVNPETKVKMASLKQFVVTTAGTTVAAGATNPIVSPAIYKSTAKQNCYCASWTGSGTIVAVAAGGSGAVSTAYTNSLVYHKDAFTFVTADLEMPKGVDFASRKVVDGVSLRIVRNYDIANDKFPCRIDVLFGYKTIRPRWAVRMCS